MVAPLLRPPLPAPGKMNNALLHGNQALSRKRSRLALEDDEDVQRDMENARIARAAELKKSKTQCELDAIDIVAPEDAWSVDVEGILSSPSLPTSPGVERQPHNNVERFKLGVSVLVLCVQGNLQLHYDLLW